MFRFQAKIPALSALSASGRDDSTHGASGSPPRRSTRAPARGPTVSRPWTAALASPANASDSAAAGRRRRYRRSGRAGPPAARCGGRSWLPAGQHRRLSVAVGDVTSASRCAPPFCNDGTDRPQPCAMGLQGDRRSPISRTVAAPSRIAVHLCLCMAFKRSWVRLPSAPLTIPSTYAPPTQPRTPETGLLRAFSEGTCCSQTLAILAEQGAEVRIGQDLRLLDAADAPLRGSTSQRLDAEDEH